MYLLLDQKNGNYTAPIFGFCTNKFYSQTNLYEAQSHSKGLYTGITSFTSIMRSQILIF